MRKIVLLFIVFLASNLLHAHECQSQTVKCPIDDTIIEFCVVVGSPAYGYMTDFEEQQDVYRYYEEQVRSCPNCHFSGFVSDFKLIFNDTEKSAIKSFLSKYKNNKMDDAEECQIAGELKEFLKEKNDKIAQCFLIGSYVLKKKANSEIYRKELQSKARYFFLKAIENEEYANASEISSINYLIAELYRRTADFKNAILYYDYVIKSTEKSPWIEEMVMIQKGLALKKDENNKI